MNNIPCILFHALLWVIFSASTPAWGQISGDHHGKKVLFLIGEHEYGTPESLPAFAKSQLEPLGIESTFIFAGSNDRQSKLCHSFEGLEQLDAADLLVLSLRRRFPRTSDLMRIRAWIEAGKPVVAVRTSSHAFGERAKGQGYQAPSGHAAWNTFDVEVLGASYQGHYRSKEGEPPLNVHTWVEPSARNHPIVQAISPMEPFLAGDKLYEYTDLDPAIEVLMSARYAEGEPAHPLAWVNEKGRQRVFYTSLGSLGEMALPQVQSLLKSAVLWGLGGKTTAAIAPVTRKEGKEAQGANLPPEQALGYLIPAEGLEIDLVAAEPNLKQPSFLRFDERGRMWVVQYRQYPLPAGLEIMSRDQFWRNKYNQVPAPPGRPAFVPGADRITIHEDKNGDGKFETVTPFLEGLNLATSVAWDRDGVWVLQPPYLLFYKDADHDDVVDGPPEVHLSGFGIEDTHAIPNSLTWGPDGWLYGAQGSTVTAAIQVAGSDEPPIKSVGQLMWRYHPKKRVYEIFAEGGGNIWSCQFDAQGRLFAGANEGRKLGYHYMQGSYNRKTFTKHGELSNPYAFGYFMGIQEDTSVRVTTNLLVYEEGVLPKRYDESIITANALAGKVLASRRIPTGPSFHSESIDVLVDSVDRWFRPVYAETGPDGALYVADWYDQQVNHLKNHEGQISVADGRIYRVRNAGQYEAVRVDLEKLSSAERVQLLKDGRRWYRDTARRLLNQRQDRSVLPELIQWLKQEDGQPALEALWAINLLGGYDEEIRATALEHSNPFVRKWAVRLIGDEQTATDWELRKLRELAATEAHIEVRQQLASSAKRLRDGGLSIVAELLRRNEDATDPFMPLLVWWALESFCGSDVNGVLALFEDPDLFDQALVQKPMLEYVMRRLASEGTRQYLRAAARLLKLSPDPVSRQSMLVGFENAFRGRPMTGFPEELLRELAKAGGGSLAMRIRQGSPGAVEQARVALEGNPMNAEERRRIIEALGEVPQEAILETLLNQLNGADAQTQQIVLSALRSYNDERVGKRVSAMYPSFDTDVRAAAQTLLTSRSHWTLEWLRAIQSGAIPKDLIPVNAIETMRMLDLPAVDSLLDAIWSRNAIADTTVMETYAMRKTLESSILKGDPYQGRQHYLNRCGACHVLHDEGGRIGPELTGYQRQNADSLWLAIADPNAEIREGYENVVVRTNDGQVLSGFIADKDEHVVVLRPVGGQPVVIEQSRIQSLESAGVSLMPPGLLAGLDEQGLVDLFSYLQSSQPLNIRK